MTKTAMLLVLIVTVLATPVNAQRRVFVSGHGLDTNPCTVAMPCRTFQQAYNTVLVAGEIDVLDPAGYGPLTMTGGGVSIQAHGFGGITQTASCSTCAAITISVTTSDPVSLNGLLLDGASLGTYGILINSSQSVSVQILNTVVRHFQYGIADGRSTGNLLVEDTIASDTALAGITGSPNAFVQSTLNRITANNNQYGVYTFANGTTIANSVLSNNSNSGLLCACSVWLAKTVISGNSIGINMGGGTVLSYGDNYINNNGTPVSGGSLTPVGMQ
jgi:Right handed beta helix region